MYQWAPRSGQRAVCSGHGRRAGQRAAGRGRMAHWYAWLFCARTPTAGGASTTPYLRPLTPRPRAAEASKATQKQQLLQMVSYAEDEFQCRRKLMLGYFNECFDPARCQRTCDNCRSGIKVASPLALPRSTHVPGASRHPPVPSALPQPCTQPRCSGSGECASSPLMPTSRRASRALAAATCPPDPSAQAEPTDLSHA